MTEIKSIFDVIVIGGGPAGLMVCNVLEENNINYILLEKNDKVGKKLLISGGRRCNVTNNLSSKNFISALNLRHKKFLFNALQSFGSKEIREFFQEKGLNLILEDNFKYFPETEKSQSVLDALLKDLDEKKIRVNQKVNDIDEKDSSYIVKTKDQTYYTKNLVIATGSNSYPTTGSSGDGLVFANKLKINYLPFTPAETSLFSSEVVEKYQDLQGATIENTIVKINDSNQTYNGDLIFTHFGLSGPAIFHASEDVYTTLLEKEVIISFPLTNESHEIILNMFTKARIENTPVRNVLEQLTTKKIANKILSILSIDNKNTNEIGKKDIQRIIDKLKNFKVKIDKVQTKERAFVNAGGILTKELNPKTMEVKEKKGLYFVGETVNLHGPIGGFNITIALSTGYICGKNIVLLHQD